MDASRKIPGSIHDEKLIIQFKYRVSRKLGTYHMPPLHAGDFFLLRNEESGIGSEE